MRWLRTKIQSKASYYDMQKSRSEKRYAERRRGAQECGDESSSAALLCAWPFESWSVYDANHFAVRTLGGRSCEPAYCLLCAVCCGYLVEAATAILTPLLTGPVPSSRHCLPRLTSIAHQVLHPDNQVDSYFHITSYVARIHPAAGSGQPNPTNSRTREASLAGYLGRAWQAQASADSFIGTPHGYSKLTYLRC